MKIVDLANFSRGYVFEGKEVKPIKFRNLEEEEKVRKLMKLMSKRALDEILEIMGSWYNGSLEYLPDGRVKLVLTTYEVWWGEEGYYYAGTLIV